MNTHAKSFPCVQCEKNRASNPQLRDRAPLEFVSDRLAIPPRAMVEKRYGRTELRPSDLIDLAICEKCTAAVDRGLKRLGQEPIKWVVLTEPLFVLREEECARNIDVVAARSYLGMLTPADPKQIAALAAATSKTTPKAPKVESKHARKQKEQQAKLLDRIRTEQSAEDQSVAVAIPALSVVPELPSVVTEVAIVPKAEKASTTIDVAAEQPAAQETETKSSKRRRRTKAKKAAAEVTAVEQTQELDKAA